MLQQSFRGGDTQHCILGAEVNREAIRILLTITHVCSYITIFNNHFIFWLRSTMGATRAQKQIYFEKLKELLAKYRSYCPVIQVHIF